MKLFATFNTVFSSQTELNSLYAHFVGFFSLFQSREQCDKCDIEVYVINVKCSQEINIRCIRTTIDNESLRRNFEIK